jgi:hypothetical protein
MNSTTPNPSLIKEACRVLDSDEKAMRCAMSHGQVTIDGYKIKPEYDRRWTRAQLKGRWIRINHRAAELFVTWQ